MASMARSESGAELSSTPTLSAKGTSVLNGGVSTSSARPSSASGRQSAPRADLETVHKTLKTQLGEHWPVYKAAVSAYSLGKLSLKELRQRVKWCERIERLHNEFLRALLFNTTCDPPEPGVASWVGANDKPSATTSKPSSGDAAELRLKTEVKELPGRERKRLKAIQDSDSADFIRDLHDYHAAKQISLPDASAVSSAGLSKTTNWDLEIRKRYSQPLCVESLELPDTSAIEARTAPICYEEGIASGPSSEAAALLNLATEAFIKRVLTNVLERVWSNSDDFIKTTAYKTRLRRDEDRWLRGDVHRNAAGLLPVEAEEAKNRQPLSLGDLRMAIELGDSDLGRVPLITAAIINNPYYDADSNCADHAERWDKMAVDDGDDGNDDWGWQGASTQDRKAIDSVLDDILAAGQ